MAQPQCHAPGDQTSTHGLNVPISIHGGGVFVPVQLNGRTLDFLLDSGFESSVLDPATAAALHITATSQHQESAPGGAVQTASIPGLILTVAGLTLPPATLQTVDLSGFAPFFGHHADGVLGYDFFARFVLVLDYATPRLTLCDAAHFSAAPAAHSLPLDLATKQPYISAQITGSDGKVVPASLEIDTGKVAPFSLSAAFARRTGLFAGPRAPGVFAVRGVSLGGDTQAWLLRARSLQLAGFTLERPQMGVAEENADRDGQLGFGVLRRFTLTFDYTHARVLLEPNQAFAEPFEFDHAGWILISPPPSFNTLSVAMVLAGSPAAAAGVQDGDRIVSIAGSASVSFTLDTARTYFERHLGPTHIVLLRGGKQVPVTITLGALF